MPDQLSAASAAVQQGQADQHAPAGTGEPDEPGRSKRTNARKVDDDDCPTNAKPKDITLPDPSGEDIIGGPLFHTFVADGDGNKLTSMHMFNLPLCGGADLAYDLAADPRQLVEDYEEAVGTEPPRIEALLPVLRAAAAAPLELEALDPWLPDASEDEVTAHRELVELIIAEGERQLREFGAHRGAVRCAQLLH